MKKHYDRAIQHVRDNKSWDDTEEAKALERMNNLRCSLNFASPCICDEIHDLLEEYGDDNELPEGWWYEFGNEDDVFLKL